MPYFEREAALVRALKSFEKYDEYKVSIVDDGSTLQPLSEVISPTFMVTLLPKKTDWRNPSVPLNMCVRQIESEHILLQSSDIYHPIPILEPLRNAIKSETDIAIAPMKTEKRNGKIGSFNGPRPEHAPFWWCQMMRRSFFETIGGFDEEFRKGKGGEDTDFAKRAVRAGVTWKIVRGIYAVQQEVPVIWKPHELRTGDMRDPNIKRLKEKFGTYVYRDKAFHNSRPR
jgi:GT2 family glycosyltransferase